MNTKQKSTPRDFAMLYQASDESARYDLDERAAIHQFDGGLTRAEAERRTFDEAQEQPLLV